jgi:hypothetical protein
MSAEKKRGTKVAARKPAGAKKKAAKRTAPAAKAKKPAKKPAVKPKKEKAAAAPAAKPAPAAQKPAERRSFFSFLGFGGPRPGKTKMTDLIKK